MGYSSELPKREESDSSDSSGHHMNARKKKNQPDLQHEEPFIDLEKSVCYQKETHRNLSERASSSRSVLTDTPDKEPYEDFETQVFYEAVNNLSTDMQKRLLAVLSETSTGQKYGNAMDRNVLNDTVAKLNNANFTLKHSNLACPSDQNSDGTVQNTQISNLSSPATERCASMQELSSSSQLKHGGPNSSLPCNQLATADGCVKVAERGQDCEETFGSKAPEAPYPENSTQCDIAFILSLGHGVIHSCKYSQLLGSDDDAANTDKLPPDIFEFFPHHLLTRTLTMCQFSLKELIQGVSDSRLTEIRLSFASISSKKLCQVHSCSASQQQAFGIELVYFGSAICSDVCSQDVETLPLAGFHKTIASQQHAFRLEVASLAIQNFSSAMHSGQNVFCAAPAQQPLALSISPQEEVISSATAPFASPSHPTNYNSQVILKDSELSHQSTMPLPANPFTQVSSVCTSICLRQTASDTYLFLLMVNVGAGKQASLSGCCLVALASGSTQMLASMHHKVYPTSQGDHKAYLTSQGTMFSRVSEPRTAALKQPLKQTDTVCANDHFQHSLVYPPSHKPAIQQGSGGIVSQDTALICHNPFQKISDVSLNCSVCRMGEGGLVHFASCSSQGATHLEAGGKGKKLRYCPLNIVEGTSSENTSQKGSDVTLQNTSTHALVQKVPSNCSDNTPLSVQPSYKLVTLSVGSGDSSLAPVIAGQHTHTSTKSLHHQSFTAAVTTGLRKHVNENSVGGQVVLDHSLSRVSSKLFHLLSILGPANTELFCKQIHDVQQMAPFTTRQVSCTQLSRALDSFKLQILDVQLRQTAENILHADCLELQAHSIEFFPHHLLTRTLTLCQFSLKELIQGVSHSRLTETRLSFASISSKKLCQVHSCSASQQQELVYFGSAICSEVCSQDVETLPLAGFHKTIASQQHAFRLEVASLAIQNFSSAMHSGQNVFSAAPAQQPLALSISPQEEVLSSTTAPYTPFASPSHPTNYNSQVILKGSELSHQSTMPLPANPFTQVNSSICLKQTASDTYLFLLMVNVGAGKQASLSGCCLVALASGSTQMLASMHHKVYPTSQGDHKAYLTSQGTMFSRVSEPRTAALKQPPKQTDTVCANDHFQHSLVYPPSHKPAIQQGSGGIVSQDTASIHHNPFQKISAVSLNCSVCRMGEGRLVHFASCSSQGATHLEAGGKRKKLRYCPLNKVKRTSSENTNQKGSDVTLQNTSTHALVQKVPSNCSDNTPLSVQPSYKLVTLSVGSGDSSLAPVIAGQHTHTSTKSLHHQSFTAAVTTGLRKHVNENSVGGQVVLDHSLSRVSSKLFHLLSILGPANTELFCKQIHDVQQMAPFTTRQVSCTQLSRALDSFKLQILDVQLRQTAENILHADCLELQAHSIEFFPHHLLTRTLTLCQFSLKELIQGVSHSRLTETRLSFASISSKKLCQVHSCSASQQQELVYFGSAICSEVCSQDVETLPLAGFHKTIASQQHAFRLEVASLAIQNFSSAMHSGQNVFSAAPAQQPLALSISPQEEVLSSTTAPYTPFASPSHPTNYNSQVILKGSELSHQSTMPLPANPFTQVNSSICLKQTASDTYLFLLMVNVGAGKQASLSGCCLVALASGSTQMLASMHHKVYPTSQGDHKAYLTSQGTMFSRVSEPRTAALKQPPKQTDTVCANDHFQHSLVYPPSHKPAIQQGSGSIVSQDTASIHYNPFQKISDVSLNSRLTETRLSFASISSKKLCQVHSCSASQQQAFGIELVYFGSAICSCSQDVETLPLAGFHKTIASQQHAFRLEVASLAIQNFSSAMHSGQNVFYAAPAQQPLALSISPQKEVLSSATAPYTPFASPSHPTNYNSQVILKDSELSHQSTMPLPANPFTQANSVCTGICLRQTASDTCLFLLMVIVGAGKQASLHDGCCLVALASGSTQMLASMHHKVYPTSQGDHKAYLTSQGTMFSRVSEPRTAALKQPPKQTDTVCANDHFQHSLVYPPSHKPAIQQGSGGIVSQDTASIHHNPFQKISAVSLNCSVCRMGEGRLVHFASCSSQGATHLEAGGKRKKLRYCPLNKVKRTSSENTNQKGSDVTLQNTSTHALVQKVPSNCSDNTPLSVQPSYKLVTLSVGSGDSSLAPVIAGQHTHTSTKSLHHQSFTAAVTTGLRKHVNENSVGGQVVLDHSLSRVSSKLFHLLSILGPANTELFCKQIHDVQQMAPFTTRQVSCTQLSRALDSFKLQILDVQLRQTAENILHADCLELQAHSIEFFPHHLLTRTLTLCQFSLKELIQGVSHSRLTETRLSFASISSKKLCQVHSCSASQQQELVYFGSAICSEVCSQDVETLPLAGFHKTIASQQHAFRLEVASLAIQNFSSAMHSGQNVFSAAPAQQPLALSISPQEEVLSSTTAPYTPFASPSHPTNYNSQVILKGSELSHQSTMPLPANPFTQVNSSICLKQTASDTYLFLLMVNVGAGKQASLSGCCLVALASGSTQMLASMHHKVYPTSQGDHKAYLTSQGTMFSRVSEPRTAALKQPPKQTDTVCANDHFQHSLVYPPSHKPAIQQGSGSIVSQDTASIHYNPFQKISDVSLNSRLTETRLSFASISSKKLCQVHSCSASQQQAFGIELVYFGSAICSCSQDVETLPLAGFHKTIASQQHAFRLEVASLAIQNFSSAMHSGQNVFYAAPAQQPLALSISPQKEVLSSATAPYTPFASPSHPTNYNSQVILKDSELSHQSTMPLPANPFTQANSVCTGICLRQTASDTCLFLLMVIVGAGKQASLHDGCCLVALASGSTQMLASMHHKVYPTSQGDHKAYLTSQGTMFSRVSEPRTAALKQPPKQTDTVCANDHFQHSLVYPPSHKPAIQQGSGGIVSQDTASIHHNPFQKISAVSLNCSVCRMGEGRLVHFASCSSQGATHLEAGGKRKKLRYCPLNKVKRTSSENTNQKGSDVTLQNTSTHALVQKVPSNCSDNTPLSVQPSYKLVTLSVGSGDSSLAPVIAGQHTHTSTKSLHHQSFTAAVTTGLRKHVNENSVGGQVVLDHSLSRVSSKLFHLLSILGPANTELFCKQIHDVQQMAPFTTRQVSCTQLSRALDSFKLQILDVQLRQTAENILHADCLELQAHSIEFFPHHLLTRTLTLCQFSLKELIQGVSHSRLTETRLSFASISSKKLCQVHSCSASQQQELVYFGSAICSEVCSQDVETLPLAGFHKTIASQQHAFRLEVASLAIQNFSSAMHSGQNVFCVATAQQPLALSISPQEEVISSTTAPYTPFASPSHPTNYNSQVILKGSELSHQSTMPLPANPFTQVNSSICLKQTASDTYLFLLMVNVGAGKQASLSGCCLVALASGSTQMLASMHHKVYPTSQGDHKAYLTSQGTMFSRVSEPRTAALKQPPKQTDTVCANDHFQHSLVYPPSHKPAIQQGSGGTVSQDTASIRHNPFQKISDVSLNCSVCRMGEGRLVHFTSCSSQGATHLEAGGKRKKLRYCPLNKVEGTSSENTNQKGSDVTLQNTSSHAQVRKVPSNCSDNTPLSVQPSYKLVTLSVGSGDSSLAPVIAGQHTHTSTKSLHHHSFTAAVTTGLRNHVNENSVSGQVVVDIHSLSRVSSKLFHPLPIIGPANTELLCKQIHDVQQMAPFTTRQVNCRRFSRALDSFQLRQAAEKSHLYGKCVVTPLKTSKLTEASLAFQDLPLSNSIRFCYFARAVHDQCSVFSPELSNTPPSLLKADLVNLLRGEACMIMPGWYWLVIFHGSDIVQSIESPPAGPLNTYTKAGVLFRKNSDELRCHHNPEVHPESPTLGQQELIVSTPPTPTVPVSFAATPFCLPSATHKVATMRGTSERLNVKRNRSTLRVLVPQGKGQHNMLPPPSQTVPSTYSRRSTQQSSLVVLRATEEPAGQRVFLAQDKEQHNGLSPPSNTAQSIVVLTGAPEQHGVVLDVDPKSSEHDTEECTDGDGHNSGGSKSSGSNKSSGGQGISSTGAASGSGGGACGGGGGGGTSDGGGGKDGDEDQHDGRKGQVSNNKKSKKDQLQENQVQKKSDSGFMSSSPSQKPIPVKPDHDVRKDLQSVTHPPALSNLKLLTPVVASPDDTSEKQEHLSPDSTNESSIPQEFHPNCDDTPGEFVIGQTLTGSVFPPKVVYIPPKADDEPDDKGVSLKPCPIPFKCFTHGDEGTMELPHIQEHPPPVEQEAATHGSGPNSTIVVESMSNANIPNESPSGSSADYLTQSSLQPAVKHFTSLAEHNSMVATQYSQPIEESSSFHCEEPVFLPSSSAHCDEIFVALPAASNAAGFLAHESAAYVSSGHFSLIEAGSEGRVSFEESLQNVAESPQDTAEPITMGDSDSSDEDT